MGCAVGDEFSDEDSDTSCEQLISIFLQEYTIKLHSVKGAKHFLKENNDAGDYTWLASLKPSIDDKFQQSC